MQISLDGEEHNGKKRKEMKKERKKKKEMKEKEEGKGRGLVVPSIFFRRSLNQGAGFVHALRGKGFSYTGSFSLKGHQWPYGSVPTLGLSFGIVCDSLRTVHD